MKMKKCLSIGLTVALASSMSGASKISVPVDNPRPISAPLTAPGADPIPPKTAATKAFRPGMAPEVGMTEL